MPINQIILNNQNIVSKNLQKLKQLFLKNFCCHQFNQKNQTVSYRTWRSTTFNPLNWIKQYSFIIAFSIYIFSLIFLNEQTRQISSQTVKALGIVSVFCMCFYYWSKMRARVRKIIISNPLFTAYLAYPFLICVAVFLSGKGVSGLGMYFQPACFLLLPFFLYYSRFSFTTFCHIIMTATMVCLIWVVYTVFYLELDRAAINELTGAIIIYDGMIMTIVLLGLLYSLHLFQEKKHIFSLLMLTVSCVAIFALIFHGSRGAWIGLVVVFIYLSIVYWHTAKSAVLLMNLLSVCFICLSFFVIQSPIKDRMVSARQDIEKHYLHDNSHSSVGARLAMWRIAWSDFQSSPIFGVGLEQGLKSRCQKYHEGLLNQCYGHYHSMYFHELAAHGLFGLTGLLFLFFSPMFLFIKHLKNAIHSEILMAARMGIVVVVYTMLCSMSDVQLYYGRSLNLYCMLITILIYTICNENRTIKNNRLM